MRVPDSFQADSNLFYHQGQKGQPRNQVNPQTTEICAKLEINDPIMLLLQQNEGNDDIQLNDSSFMNSSTIDDNSDFIADNTQDDINETINTDEIKLLSDSDESDDDEHECSGVPVKCENIKVVAHLSNLKTSTPNLKRLSSESDTTDNKRSRLNLPDPSRTLNLPP